MASGEYLWTLNREESKIHDFCMDFDSMQSRLNSLSAKYPAGLIIPAKRSALESPALRHIITELNKCDYLKKVLIALYATNPKNERAEP